MEGEAIAVSRRAEDLHNSPSRGEVDKIDDAWQLLRQREWVVYKSQYPSLHRTRILVAGRTAPLAKTETYRDNSTLIVINDGLVSHLETMARIMMAGSSFTDDDRLVEKTVLSSQAVADLLRRCNEQWVAREKNEAIEPLEIPLGPIATVVATHIFRAAIVFTILHEFGHAALDHGKAPNPASHELEADRWATKALFATAAAAHTQTDYLLGGAFLSVRALASRERTGKADLHGYPPSSLRFTTVVDGIRGYFGSELEFYLRTTQAFAYDMHLQTEEHHLGADVALAPSLPEQCTSLIASLLLAVTKMQITLDSAVGEITLALKRVPQIVLQQTIEICQRAFTSTTCIGPEAGRRLKVVELFANEIAPRLTTLRWRS